MSDTHDQPATDPRKALESSERAASAGQPKNYRDAATDKKVVDVDPIAPSGDDAIKGIDPR